MILLYVFVVVGALVVGYVGIVGLVAGELLRRRNLDHDPKWRTPRYPMRYCNGILNATEVRTNYEEKCPGCVQHITCWENAWRWPIFLCFTTIGSVGLALITLASHVSQLRGNPAATKLREDAQSIQNPPKNEEG